MQSQTLYTSASANRASQVADWTFIKQSQETELIYASNKSIVFAQNVGQPHPPASRLVPTPNGLLTSVKYAYNLEGCGMPKALAASNDGWLYLFTRDSTSSHSQGEIDWRIQQQWQTSSYSSSQQQQKQDEQTSSAARKPFLRKAKTTSATGSASIRALGVVRQSQRSFQSDKADGDEYLFASASSDGTLQIWRVQGDQGQVEQLQSISLGRSRAETQTEVLPLDIAIARIPSTKHAVLLTVAGTDSKIDVFLAEDGRSFQKVFSLLGHTDWVRSLDICQTDNNALMLASGSQDHGIRLWHVSVDLSEDQTSQQSAKVGVEQDLDEFDRLAMQIEEGEDEAIATKMQMFRCEGRRYSIAFDALLVGHEHWVTGVRWAPAQPKGQPAALLSSSADNSVILWTPSSCVQQAMTNLALLTFDDVSRAQQQQQFEQDVWVAVHRFGEVGSVGSAANGMYGVTWDPAPHGDRQAVLAHGYGGALHVWSRTKDQSWKAVPGKGGHFAPASCVRWEPGGQYIISGGLDKTTRLHGCFRTEQGASWHEVARPQTHGYEITGLSWLSRLAFASAGDEKVIRAFEAPQGFVDSAQSLGLVQVQENSNVLAFSIPNVAQFSHSDHLASPIKEATRRSLHKGKLDIVVVSPLFDGIAHSDTLNVTFRQAESFLKWCYAQAWSEAVEADELLFDVDILLLGTQSASAKLTRKCLAEAIFVVDIAENRLPFSLQDAILLPCEGTPSEGQTNRTERSNDAAFPTHEAIVLGGTFDHLHVGHKILLSMACLLASRRIIVGVTDDSMLSKKKHASVLESTQQRIARVSRFMTKFSRSMGRTTLKFDIVPIRDVAGPAGWDADLTALLFTDETITGADFVDGEREKRGLGKLARFTITLIGASGETDVHGKDSTELAAAKVGSTAIRGWLEGRKKSGTSITPPADRVPTLDQVPTLSGEPRPLGASVPPLGLSNRAIHGSAADQAPLDGPSESGQPIGKAIRSIAAHLVNPPVEEELHNNSLWSEVTKVYGHPLELLAIDTNLASGLIASSCKATQAELAGVRLYDSRNNWQEVQVLTGHSLGVTRVRFSNDGSKIVTVSRDRSWRVYCKHDNTKGDQGTFKLQSVREEAHSRIIYDVAWCGANAEFATVSRDGLVKVWDLSIKGSNSEAECTATLTLKQPLTAIAATCTRDMDLLAVGSEKGTVWIYSKRRGAATKDWQLQYTLNNLHADALNELAWQPVQTDQQQSLASLILASAGQDGAVRLTNIENL